jgi:dolichyl-phosphate-mannose--protein O-mannosyl transferase
MFNYHSKLVDSHPYASPWYEWPLIIRPMWYNKAIMTVWIATINAMGNPAVWWVRSGGNAVADRQKMRR